MRERSEVQGGADGVRSLVIVSAAATSALPVVGYLTFNAWLFGAPFGGYFAVVKGAGGAAISTVLERGYSHLIDASAFYAEPSADWLTRVPRLAFFVCFLLPALFWMPLFLRVVAGLAILHFALVYCYADAVPTGQFRYYNIHYFKWMFPVLPVFFIYPWIRTLRLRSRGDRSVAAYELGLGTGLFLLALSLRPSYVLMQPLSVSSLDAETIELQFKRAVRLDFIDVSSLTTSFGHFDPRTPRVRINGSTDLVPIVETRLTPRPGGVRFVLTGTPRVSSARLNLSGLGDLRSGGDIAAIAGEVHLIIGAPWKKEAPLPSFPPAPIAIGKSFFASDATAAGRYFGNGWSSGEAWGRWMDGASAELRFSLPADTPETAQLVLEGIGFLPAQQPEVAFEVIMNGVRTDVVRLSRSGPHRFAFPLPKQRSSFGAAISVELHALATKSPREVGLNSDERRLSFGLIRFEVTP